MAKLEMSDTKKMVKTTENEKNSKIEAPQEKVQGTDTKLLIKLSETITFEINKPLLLLKVAVFCWFGAGASVTPFLALFLKQRGLPLKDLSFIYMVLPIAQFLGPTISGMIADKIGRSKPVLQANLFLTILTTTSMIFIPQMTYCNKELIRCNTRVINENITAGDCNIKSNGSDAFSCSFLCSLDKKLDNICFENYIASCDPLSEQGFSHEFPWSTNNSDSQKYAKCVKTGNITAADFWCPNHLVNDCNVTCEMNVNSTKSEAPCDDSGQETRIFIISFILLGAFHTFYSNCYRIVDVTAMIMIKTYNSDFGRVRFWSIFGILVFSPLAGYVIALVTPDGAPQKFETIFYLFGPMGIITMLVVWKLDVKTEPPSKDLFKKTLGLLKNLDVIAFFIAIFVIGTAWGFTKLFSNWYLEELGAPSSLIGLIPAVNSILGLPFLLTSKWFVDKIGSTKLLIAAMVGYATWCIAYSFLQNPWWSLVCEVLGIVNYHLLWVSVVTHSHFVAPIGFAATVISAAGGIHFGVGKGSGSVIGGYVMSQYGGKLAYRLMAIVCIVSAVFYSVYLFIRRRFTKKEFELEQLASVSTYTILPKVTGRLHVVSVGRRILRTLIPATKILERI